MQGIRRISRTLALFAIAVGIVAVLAHTGCQGDEKRPTYPKPTHTVMDLAIADPDLSSWVDAVRKAGLFNALNSDVGDYTVFAPTNTALAGKTSTVNAVLSAQIRYMIAPGSRTLATLRCEKNLATITATTIRITHTGTTGVCASKPMAGSTAEDIQLSNSRGQMANIVKGDIGDTTGGFPYGQTLARNGILHKVDGVLTPPPPVLSSLSPAMIGQRRTAFTLTANGASFVSGASTIVFQGVPTSVCPNGSCVLATTFNTSSQLQADLPKNALAMAGMYQVKVFTPTVNTTGVVSFTVTSTAPIPDAGPRPDGGNPDAGPAD